MTQENNLPAAYNSSLIKLTKYFFFTGKGGVGKTSTACATAVDLADKGKRVMLISTDPASNLQDVFEVELNNKGTLIQDVPNLTVVNLDPVEAAKEYKEKVVGPYKGLLPEAVIESMNEQLSGSCTVEIAAFNEFSHFLTDEAIKNNYDHVIFDTAPTGHTLRMLQLPSAWSNFISENTHGASCLGQLSGLEKNKAMYKQAVETLADKNLTTVILVARPEKTPLLEAKRASEELREIGAQNQVLIINGVLEKDIAMDQTALSLYNKQQQAFREMPDYLREIVSYYIPLRAYNVYGVKNIRAMLTDNYLPKNEVTAINKVHELAHLIDDIYATHKKVIFTMGKGGVGKSTLAAAIAVGLVQKGLKVHLTTTDPAHHLKFMLSESDKLTISHINEELELEKYRKEVLEKARETMGDEDLAYIEEDLRSPCTQEIAVFRAFAEIVEKAAANQVVVIDTAPTGHTLLLLDAAQSYHKEIQKSQGDIPESVKKLLPTLRNAAETEVVIVTLPEATPVQEAVRLADDLKRADIHAKWWVINSSLYLTNTKTPLLKAKSQAEIDWINKVEQISQGNTVLIKWCEQEFNYQELLSLVKGETK